MDKYRLRKFICLSYKCLPRAENGIMTLEHASDIYEPGSRLEIFNRVKACNIFMDCVCDTSTCNQSIVHVSAKCDHLIVFGDLNRQPPKRLCYMYASRCFTDKKPAATQASLLYACISMFRGIQPATTQAYLLHCIHVCTHLGVSGIITCSHSSVSAKCTD